MGGCELECMYSPTSRDGEGNCGCRRQGSSSAPVTVGNKALKETSSEEDVDSSLAHSEGLVPCSVAEAVFSFSSWGGTFQELCFARLLKAGQPVQVRRPLSFLRLHKATNSTRVVQGFGLTS